MKVLVTGGAGFLGGHVSDALARAGHHVVIFDIKSPVETLPGQSVFIGDVLDAAALQEAAKGCDAIYHFAAVADIGEAAGNPTRTLQINIMGTLNALEAGRFVGVQRFVLASSIYVYSHQGSFYRTSKQASENLVHDYADRFGMRYTILRFGSLYGPRAGASNAIHRMLTEALKERQIHYPGTGEEVREYIHVFDGAAAAVEILDHSFENEIVHLTGHERMKTREMISMIAEILGGDLQITLNAGSMAGHYMQTPYSYNPKLGRKLIRNTYIDLGLGLLDLLEHIHQSMPAEEQETQ